MWHFSSSSRGLHPFWPNERCNRRTRPFFGCLRRWHMSYRCPTYVQSIHRHQPNWSESRHDPWHEWFYLRQSCKWDEIRLVFFVVVTTLLFLAISVRFKYYLRVYELKMLYQLALSVTASKNSMNLLKIMRIFRIFTIFLDSTSQRILQRRFPCLLA